WQTAFRCATPPSCIKCRTTPLFQEPSPRRRASRPISRVTSRYARCKATLAARGDGTSGAGKLIVAASVEAGRDGIFLTALVYMTPVSRVTVAGVVLRVHLTDSR